MEILGVRPLEEADAAKRGRPEGSLAKIREVHHLVARLFARGHKPPDIAAKINRTAATVRNWLGTPAMQELVASYAGDFTSEVTSEMEYGLELKRRARTLADEELVRRLEEDAASMPVAQLVKIAADAADRTGLGKTETKVNLNMDLGSRLDRARDQAARVSEAREVSAENVVKFVRRT